MSYDLKGKIHKIFPTEKKTETFQTRELVLETQEQYPQWIKFQLVQENCQILDHLVEGQQVNVKFDLKGREWNGKYFTNLQAWKIEVVQNEPVSEADTSLSPESFGADIETLEMDDDLPF